MVSDASSGPRHYCEDYEECLDENGSFCSAPAAPEPAKKNSKNKKKIKEHGSNQHHSYLDDTASSTVISFSKNKNCKKEASIDLVDFSQGFSGTHFKVLRVLTISFKTVCLSFLYIFSPELKLSYANCELLPGQISVPKKIWFLEIWKSKFKRCRLVFAFTSHRYSFLWKFWHLEYDTIYGLKKEI
ncbi:hypothetical protein REPUB_Repub19eG0059000 [Reevesia pubescens]